MTIKEFLNVIGVGSEPKSVNRLGERKDDRRRPFRLIMSTKDEKDEIMSSLNKLKDATEKFKRISVTDDYTVKEREEIRKMVDEAKHKTVTEGAGKYIYKVRGTPKNGLVIRRFAVQKQSTTSI